MGSNIFNFEKDFIGKKILVIGGGTSTLDVRWENLEVDSIWTCNDFFLEQRLLEVPIEVYMLGHNTPLDNDTLVNKLNNDNTFTFYEPVYYRGKQASKEFIDFTSKLNNPVYASDIPIPFKEYSAAQKAGAALRLIILGVIAKAQKIYFSGLDGFNREFTNIHAFTKHPGLKPTDTRRTYEGTFDSYRNVFCSAFEFLAELDQGTRILQNLGEGFDYNIGTEISRKRFPLDPKVKELIKM